MDLAGAAFSGLENLPDVPLRIGGYELVSEIARGGMGVVYRALHSGLGREVALKLIVSERLARVGQVQRFYAEARAVARLDHPNIVPVYEAGEDDGRHFIAMKLLDGGTLADTIKNSATAKDGEAISPAGAAALISKIARAVHYAHERGVLHRDLKPANILLDAHGEPHVADFGLARLMDEDTGLTGTMTVMGTPDYLAPEIPKHGTASATVASDVYGLGAILYELLCGTPPFSAPTHLEILRRATDEEAVPPSLRRAGSRAGRKPTVAERDLDTICLKCLSKDPARRYSSASAAADDLDRWIAGEAILARPESTVEKLVRKCRRSPALSAAVFALALSVVGGVAAGLWQAHLNRLNLYAADLRLASEALRNGDLGHTRDLLRRHADMGGDFAWRHLWKHSGGDQLAVADVHPWIVNDVAWSPDGRHLLSGSVGSGTVGDAVRLADIAAGSLAETVGTNGARSVAWFPDGRRFMTANVDGRVRIWDFATRRVLRDFPGLTAVLSADGSKLATCSGNPFPWDETPAGPAAIRDPDGNLPDIALPDSRVISMTRDGKIVAASDANSSITLHESATGKVLRTLPSEGKLWSMEFSPDGRMLVATGWNEDVRLWRLDSAEEHPVRLKGHSLSTWQATFSPDGRRLVSTSSDQTLRLWNLPDGSPAGVLRGHGGEVWCAAFSPDGKRIASGGKDRLVMLWPSDPPSFDSVSQHSGDFRPVFMSDGAALLTVPGGKDAVGNRLVQLGRKTLEPASMHGSPLALLPDGSLLAHAADRTVTWYRPGGPREGTTVRLQNDGDDSRDHRSAVTPDGTLIAGATDSGVCSVWKTGDGRRIARFDLPKFIPQDLAISPDRRWLAVAAEESGAWLCPLDGGSPLHLTNHLDQVITAGFSADSETLATGSVDGTIKLWKVRSGVETATLRGHRTSVGHVSFAPDGLILASVEQGYSVRLWHLPTLREVDVIPMSDSLEWLRFSPDGRYLAVLVNGGVRLLEAPSAP